MIRTELPSNKNAGHREILSARTIGKERENGKSALTGKVKNEKIPRVNENR